MADTASDILKDIDYAAVLGSQITAEDLIKMNPEEAMAIRDMADDNVSIAEAPTQAAEPEPLPEEEPAREPAPAAAAPAPAAPEPEPEPLPEPVDVTPIRAKLAELDTQRDTLLDQYDNGEISREDLNTKQREIDQALVQARMEINQAEAAQQQREQAEAGAYWKRIEAVAVNNPEYWSPKHAQGFNEEVLRLQNSSAFKNGAMTIEECLVAAMNNYRAPLSSAGIRLPDPVVGKGKPAPAAETPAKRTVDPQPSLAFVPQSDVGAAVDGTFAALDRLMDSDNPYAAEEALARLTPDQHEAYLASL